MDVKFINGKDFKFSIGTWKKEISAGKKEKGKSRERENVDDLDLIGTSNFQTQDVLTKNSCKELVFKVDMGDDTKSLLVLKHLLNCIGEPRIKQTYFDIKGVFELGMYSEDKKGWTIGRDVAIEWIFTPTIQEKVYFMAGEGCEKTTLKKPKKK